MFFDDKLIRRFLDRTLGSPSHLSIYNRAFNAVTLATALAVFLIFLNDFQINLEPKVYLVTLSLSLIQGILYWFGRKGHYSIVLAWILFAIDLGMLVYVWATFGGLVGLSSVLAVAILAILPMLFRAMHLIISWVLTVGTLVVLFILEFHSPRPVVNYPDFQTLLSDYFLTVLFLSSCVLFLVWMLAKSIQLQQDRINTLNEKLESRNKELKAKNEALSQAVEERTESLEVNELLLREMNHRVKNNLAIIQSLLSLEADRFHDSESKQAFQQSSMRIHAISAIHDQLSNTKNLKKIPIAGYFEKLIGEIKVNFENPGLPVTLDVDIENIEMDLDKFLPLALIANELVSNAYKYAFTGRDEGRIWIRIASRGEMVQLVVRDDGIGLPAGFSLNDTQSLGMRIIQAFVRQTDGESRFESSDEGTVFTIDFVQPASNEHRRTLKKSR